MPKFNFEKIVNHAKVYGFVYPGSEIYGGLANSWDYGPLGVSLKNNIKNLWWKKFVVEHQNVVGLDSSIILNPKVWKASGHVDTFNDPLVDCKYCKSRFRADKLVESFDPTIKASAMTQEELNDFIQKNLSRVPAIVALLVISVITIVWYLIPANEFSLIFTVKTVILFVIWMAFAISCPMKLLGNSITKALSQVSLEVYLSHMMIFQVVEKFGIERRINNGNIAYIVVLFLTVVLTITFALIAKKVIDICFIKLKKAEI